MPKPTPIPEPRYRIVCYELEAGQQTVIFHDTARGFIAVTGTITEDGTMNGKGTHAGPLTLRRRLARLIVDDEQLANAVTLEQLEEELALNDAIR